MFGAARTPQQTEAPTRADALADVVLADTDGLDVRVGDLWSERPAVLVFLRHYGWLFCREHAVQLHRDRDRFEEAGVTLAVIGMGQPGQARDFKRKQKLEITLLADPERKTYKAAGAKKATVGELVGPRVVAKGLLHAARERKVQGMTVGHPAQLGGVLVVDTDGAVVWSHLADDAGDNPPNERVLEAARQASKSA